MTFEKIKDIAVKLGINQSELNSILQSNDVILVPQFRKNVFAYVDTQNSIASYLNTNNIKVGFIENDDVETHELFHDWRDIGTIVISVAVLPLVINLISSYTYDAIKANKNIKIKTTIITIDKNNNIREVIEDFEGDVESFNKLIKNIGNE